MTHEWLAKARRAALRGDYAAAGDLYRLAGRLSRALSMYRKGRHHRLAGQAALQMGDCAAASREFELGGMTLEAAEQAVRAGDCERAVRLFVSAGQARRAAQLHEERGRLASAAALYEHAGDLPRAARLFLDAREAAGAARVLEALHRNTDMSPRERRDLTALAVGCGRLLLDEGAPGAAAPWLERAGRQADAAQAWEQAGQPEHAIRAWLAAGAPDRAAAVADQQAPGAIEPALAALAFRAAGRLAEAASLFLEAGQPTEAAVCLEQLGCTAEAAWAHEAAGDLTAAAASFEKAGRSLEAAELFRRAGSVRHAARCFEAAGDLTEAARCALAGGDRLTAATLRERLGDVDGALKVLQEGALDPEQTFAAALLLGRLFERKGLDALAVEQYRRALTAEPEHANAVEALYRLAGPLERLGRRRDATAVLRRAVARDLHYRDAAQRLAALERSAAAELRQTRSLQPPERYTVETLLEGRGPGAAWLAKDAVMDRLVVLRRLGRDLIANERAAERVLGDVRRAAHLHHPAIAAIHDAGRAPDGIYIVEEHVPGRSLRETLTQEGPLDAPRAVQIMTRIAEALDYAHGLGLLGRNIRPEAIVLTPSGEAKLIDFGLALRHSDGAGPQSPYRPPEALRHERMDPSSDLYLLGVVSWEMLTGAAPPPPSGDHLAPALPQSTAHPIPELVRRVVSGCLHPDRAQRIGSAQRLLEELHGTHLLPGALLANRYEILRELGRGGMGAVFAGQDLVLDEPVALKVLAGALDETTEKRFIQEIRLARQINHPNVVRVHTFERWRELRFIVMEHVEGADLRRWVHERQPVPLTQALDILAGVAAGLAAAHQLGIVHRDVKPENVLLDAEAWPRLVDFGIARQKDLHLTREGLVMGSPTYMAPEQIRGAPLDQRADVYALGALAFFVITGREAFTSESVAEVLRQQLEEPAPRLRDFRPEAPAAVEELVQRALVKDPAERTTSVSQFIEELSAARTSLALTFA